MQRSPEGGPIQLGGEGLSREGDRVQRSDRGRLKDSAAILYRVNRQRTVRLP